jgi:hypothetical protein
VGASVCCADWSTSQVMAAVQRCLKWPYGTRTRTRAHTLRLEHMVHGPALPPDCHPTRMSPTQVICPSCVDLQGRVSDAPNPECQPCAVQLLGCLYQSQRVNVRVGPACAQPLNKEWGHQRKTGWTTTGGMVGGDEHTDWRQYQVPAARRKPLTISEHRMNCTEHGVTIAAMVTTHCASENEPTAGCQASFNETYDAML